MIIAKAPLRISFVGGGSDIPSFYQKYGGAVISATIDKYIYVAVNERYDLNSLRLSYSKTEIVSHVDELEHDIARATLKRCGIERGIEIASMADVPAGTGLGSSGAFTVALLAALFELDRWKPRGQIYPEYAEIAAQIEIEDCGRAVGKQDHYAPVYGGLNHFVFTDDDVGYSRLFWPELASHLLLFDTGIRRDASEMLRLQQNPPSEENVKAMLTIVPLVIRAIEDHDLESFGYQVGCAWRLKRFMTGVTSREIDGWYDRGMAAGALGGKLLGAGGGGFMLFVAPRVRHKDIIAALPELRHLPFQLSTGGTVISRL